MECLEKIWSQLGVGENGYLNKPELLTLCQHVGVHASEDDISELFNGLNVDDAGRVSFQELVQLFHASKVDTEPEMGVGEGAKLGEDSGFAGQFVDGLNSGSFRGLVTVFGELDPFSTGLVSWDALCRWWEDRGVEDSESLLRALGVSPPDVRSVNSHASTNGGTNGRINHMKTLASLKGRSMSTGSSSEMVSIYSVSQMLEKDYTSFLNSSRKIGSEMFVVIAALVAFKDYSSLLKTDLESANQQMEKVRQDLAFANARAASLAQEVDDQNSRMEGLEKERLKELEAEQAEKLRQLRRDLEEARQVAVRESQYAEETASKLEKSEAEKAKISEKLAAFKEELVGLEETQEFLRQSLAEKTEETVRLIAQLERYEKAHAQDELKALEEEENATKKLEEIDRLKMEVLRLKAENGRLYDENDELGQHARNLCPNCERAKRNQSDPHWPDIMSDVVVGGTTDSNTTCSSMSTSASPSSAENSPQASPSKKRLERAKSFGGRCERKRLSILSAKKHRKSFSHVTRVPSLSQELCHELNKTSPVSQDEVEEEDPRSEEALENLEEGKVFVKVNGQELPTGNEKISGILSRLEKVVLELQSCSDEGGDVQKEIVSRLCPTQTLTPGVEVAEVGIETDLTMDALDEQTKSIEESGKKVTELEEARMDLRAKLDFLQAEYDDSEDYWQQKMEEERQYYEGHINSLSEKLNSLLVEFQTKLAEYEAASGQPKDSASSQSETKGKGGNSESLQQSSLPTIYETEHEIQVIEAEAEAKKWESLYEEAEVEKAALDAKCRHIVTALNAEWLKCVTRIYEGIDTRVSSLSDRVAPLSAAVVSAKTAAVGWKMRAWEAEGLVHDLETEKVEAAAEEEKRKLREKGKGEGQEAEYQRLSQKLWQEEAKAKHLESSLKQQSEHSNRILNEMNRQHCAEVQELKQLLSATRGRLQEQLAKFSTSGQVQPFGSHPQVQVQMQRGQPPQQLMFHHGQMVQEMQAQNDRLSASLKSLNSGSPRRLRGGTGATVDDMAAWRMSRHEEIYWNGPWSLPPTMGSPVKRTGVPVPPQPPHFPPQSHFMNHPARNQSSWSVFGHQPHLQRQPAQMAPPQPFHQQQARKRPPPAPPGYVHVSQPGDTYI